MGSKWDVETEELDLVEEFRVLDEMGDHVDIPGRLGALTEREPPEGLEASIGDDLSGILALDEDDDDDDEEDDDDEGDDGEEDPLADTIDDIGQGGEGSRGLADPAASSAHVSPSPHAVATGREVEEDLDEIAARKRHDPEGDGNGLSSKKIGGNVAIRAKNSVPAEGDGDWATRRHDVSGNLQPPDVMSPMLEDGGTGLQVHGGESSGDGEVGEGPRREMRGDVAEASKVRTSPMLPPYPLSPPSRGLRRPLPTLDEGCGMVVAETGDLPGSQEHHPGTQSRFGTIADSRGRMRDAGTQEDMPPRSSMNRGDQRRVSLGSQDAGPSHRAENAGGIAAKGAEIAAAEKIKSLQAELSLLKEHVLRCEQKREAQLRELHARLEVQEHRNRSGMLGPGEARKSREALDGEASASAPETPGAPEGTRGNEEEDTPSGAAVHNPFAAQEGGTDTPRDHFPAFEDALHDAGSDCALARAVGEAVEEGEDDKSRQSEAFEFSIDTLSHINNHTDFGTEVPVTAPAAGGMTSRRNSKREGKARPDAAGRGGVISVESHRDAALRRQEADEVFDAQDTAAEEAFFADACATAILQTPVKHAVAAMGSAADGVVVRRARQNVRSTQGIPENKDCDKEEAAASAHGTQTLSDGDTTGSFARGERAPGSRRGSEGADSQELCMADFFARATKQLEDTSTKAGGLPLPNKDGEDTTEMQRGGKPRPETVNAATQTGWSFSAHHGVRFVSTPLRTPLGTLEGVKKGDIDQGPERDSRWALRYPPDSGSPGDGRSVCGGKRASSWGRRGRETSVTAFRDLQQDEGLFRTPLASRPRAWRVSRETPESGDVEEPRGGMSGHSEASTYFQSPGLSPIVDMRPSCPGRLRSTTEEAQAKDEGLRDEMVTNGRACKQGEGLVENHDAPRSSQRRRSRRAMTPGLSPITSERGEGSGRLSPVRMATGHSGGARSTCAKSRVDSTSRSSVDDSFCRESSLDASGRSSLYMASTTLESMAPLDGTTQSFASHLRGNSSFAGELFADERLRECCSSSIRPARRGRGYHHHPQPRRSERGKWLVAPPPPRARTGRRQGHSRTLSPPSPLRRDEAVDTMSAAEELGRSSMRINGVPPAVVGAWLAAAIEGFYGQRGGSGSRSGGDCRERAGLQDLSAITPSTFDALDPDVSLDKSILTDSRGRRAHPAALLKEASELGIRDKDAQFDYVRAMARPLHTLDPGDSPPPPPPPPPSPPLDPTTPRESCVENSVGQAHPEDGLFFQRQRLLHKVSAATVGHSAGTHAPLGGAARSDLRVEEPLEECGVDWRRHSDPFLGRSPLLVSTRDVAPRVSEGFSGAAGNGCTSWGAPSYLRRHTSQYWRERLGMSL